ncbi:MAG: UvrD-helicase domain-containing protein [Candidatus Liptonbacteria bacterium]|nr:UvrD-helicase domain-containing protein [Candidatus Liptonbacteria bacterium]
MDAPLNPEQQKAASAPHGPLLIVAGAGTGKTKTLTSRLLRLIEEGVVPSCICALTFTNKAAKEMANRVATMTNDHNDDGGHSHRHSHRMNDLPFIGTFHSLGAKVLRAEARAVGRTQGFTIFDDGDSLSAMKKVMKELDFRTGKPAQALRYISWKKSGAGEGVDAGTRDDKKIFERYEAFLARANAFDFDDLIAKTVALFEHSPETLARYQKRYTHILVDEYQDVSPAQYTLVRLLAGRRAHVSVVGDDAQMIYGWRYANLDTFLHFERDWPGARVVLLEENYRSTAIIVRAASAVAAQNAFARKKELWTRNPDGELLTIAETADEDDEAEWVGAQIARTMTDDDHHDAGYRHSHGHGHAGNSVAVLYRTNAQSRALEQALLRRNITYKIYGGLKFYERREIKDIVAGLRLAINPRDEMSRDRLEKAFRVRVFENVVATLTKCGGTSPRAAIEKFLAATDYFEHLERETTNAEERRENITELLRFAEGFTNLADFLEHVSLVQSTDDVNANCQLPIANCQPVVHLSTIHLAKGLEFDRVFLAGCAEGLLPHARSIETEDATEEERRLMYVGMTRARKKLSISFFGIPSRFLGEIPEDLMAYEKTSGAADDENSEGAAIQLN